MDNGYACRQFSIARESYMKTVFITGGSRGIGKAIAQKFEAEGYRIVAPSHRELDLSSPESVDAFIMAHRQDVFDVIINNAGINEINLLENITDDELDRMMQVNLLSPIRLLRGLVGPMKENEYGRIVNIGSIWAVVSREGRLVYSATKNALHGVTNTLALELGPYNILVNTVCPGYVLTELTRKNNTDEEIEKISHTLPLRRMADPSEIAEFVYFLASEKNTFITGQKIAADGGFTIQ